MLVVVLAAAFLLGHAFHAGSVAAGPVVQPMAEALAGGGARAGSAVSAGHHGDHWSHGHHRLHGLSCLATLTATPNVAVSPLMPDALLPLATAPAAAVRLPAVPETFTPPLFLLHASFLI